MLENGRAKLAAKGCDLLVVNQVGGGLAFGTSDNEAVVLAADGSRIQVPRGPKEVLADVIWDLVAGPAGLAGLAGPVVAAARSQRRPGVHFGETSARYSRKE